MRTVNASCGMPEAVWIAKRTRSRRAGSVCSSASHSSHHPGRGTRPGALRGQAVRDQRRRAGSWRARRMGRQWSSGTSRPGLEPGKPGQFRSQRLAGPLRPTRHPTLAGSLRRGPRPPGMICRSPARPRPRPPFPYRGRAPRQQHGEPQAHAHGQPNGRDESATCKGLCRCPDVDVAGGDREPAAGLGAGRPARRAAGRPACDHLDVRG